MIAAAAAVTVAGPALGAGATTIRAEYVIGYAGLAIAQASTASTIEAGSYQARIDARVSGIGFGTGFRLSLDAKGLIRRSGVQPANFVWTQASEDPPRSRRITLVGGIVRDVEIVPPPDDLDRRVPLRDEHKTDVIDPASLLLMAAAPGGASLGPAVCNRTLRMFDGLLRTDYALSFVRIEEARTPGYVGPVAVCAVRYIPIAGHDPSSATTKFLQGNPDIEIRLGAVPDTPYLVLVSASVPLPLGTASIRLEKLQVEAASPSTSR